MNLLTEHRITRKYSEPIRTKISYAECWKGDDGGLIRCWENGREWRQNKQNIAQRAMHGELPIMNWTGGISDGVKYSIKLKAKYGTLYYLAQLQGILGGDLDIAPALETPLICYRTGWVVVMTGDRKKYLSEEQLNIGDVLKIYHAKGRQFRETNPALARRAERGEFPAFNWSERNHLVPHTPCLVDSRIYQAMWQALRGDL